MPVSKDRPRRPVHVCRLCSAIWEGAVAPPPVCPQCGSSSGWSAAEVGDHPGMVGGRVFIQGTDKPMTRVFICRACTKTVVARGDTADPTTCPHCKSEEPGILVQAMTGKKPEPPASPPRPAMAAVESHAAREVAEAPAHVPEKGDPKRPPETSPVLSPEEYRAEWISDRVAAWFDRSGSTIGSCTTADLWTAASSLYDEGQRRGLLP